MRRNNVQFLSGTATFICIYTVQITGNTRERVTREFAGAHMRVLAPTLASLRPRTRPAPARREFTCADG